MNLSKCCNAEIIKTEADENPSLYQCSGCGDMHRLRSLIEQDEPAPPTSTEEPIEYNEPPANRFGEPVDVDWSKNTRGIIPISSTSTEVEPRHIIEELATEYLLNQSEIKFGTFLSKCEQAISHLIQQAELRGRIDELDNFILFYHNGDKRDKAFCREMKERKAELQAQLNQLGGSDNGIQNGENETA